MIYRTNCKMCGGNGYIRDIVDGYETLRECECIQALNVERYLRNSGVDYAEYIAKSLETFQTDTEEQRRMKALAEKFLSDENARGIGYFGKPGTGKTHICIAVCQELTRKRGYPHSYFSYRREMQRLRGAYYHNEEYGELMYKWQNCKVLYIDDLLKFAKGTGGNLLSQELQITYDIINARYINKALTVICSEYTVAELCEIDQALGSRIFEMVNPYAMKCTGKNRRITK